MAVGMPWRLVVFLIEFRIKIKNEHVRKQPTLLDNIKCWFLNARQTFVVLDNTCWPTFVCRVSAALYTVRSL